MLFLTIESIGAFQFWRFGYLVEKHPGISAAFLICIFVLANSAKIKLMQNMSVIQYAVKRLSCAESQNRNKRTVLGKVN